MTSYLRIFGGSAGREALDANIGGVRDAIAARGPPGSRARGLLLCPPHLFHTMVRLLGWERQFECADLFSSMCQLTPAEGKAAIECANKAELALRWGDSGKRVLLMDESGIQAIRTSPKLAGDPRVTIVTKAWARVKREATEIGRLQGNGPPTALQLFVQGHIDARTGKRARDPDEHFDYELLYSLTAQQRYEDGSSTLLRLRELATGLTLYLDYAGCALLADASVFCKDSGFEHCAVTHPAGAQARASLTLVATWRKGHGIPWAAVAKRQRT